MYFGKELTMELYMSNRKFLCLMCFLAQID